MSDRHPKRKTARLAGAIAIAALAFFALPSFASGALLQNFTAEVRDQNGDPFTQAGGHPFEAFTDINFRQHRVGPPPGQPVPDESVRTVQVDLPVGLVGNPQNIPQCTREQLSQGLGACPDNTQVGVTFLKVNDVEAPFPVFNMVPPPGVPAQFAFVPLIPRVFLNASVRPDGGLRITIPNISQALPLTGTSLSFWGVPAASAHDADRGQCLQNPPTRRRALPVAVRPVAVPHQPDLVCRPGDHPPARQLVAERRLRAAQLDHPGGRRRLQRGALRSHGRRPVVREQLGQPDRDLGGRQHPPAPEPDRDRAGEPEDGRGDAARGHDDQPVGRRRLGRLHGGPGRPERHGSAELPERIQDRRRGDRQPAATGTAPGRDLSGDPEREPVRQPARDLSRRPGRRRDGEARRPDRGRPGDRPGDDDDRQRAAAAVLALQPRLQGRLTGPLGHPPDLRDQDRVGVPDAVERQPPDRAHATRSRSPRAPTADRAPPRRRPGRLPPA